MKSNVKLFQIESKAIENMKMASAMQSEPLKALKGTMMIHQIIVPRKGELLHRKLSCFCGNLAESKEICPCYSPRHVQVKAPKMSNTPVIEKTELKAPEAKKRTGKAVSAIEDKLAEEQVKGFQTRLENGYDVVHSDLSALSSSEKEEYIYWKAWKGAKLQAHLNEEQHSTNSDDSDYDNEQQSSNSDDSFNDDEQQSSNSDDSDYDDEQQSSNSNDSDYDQDSFNEDDMRSDKDDITIEEGHFYAIFFRSRRTRTFYIGRPTGRQDQNTLEFKFLEKRLGKGTFLYSWPKRDDICYVEKSAVLKKLDFNGPPPFLLENENEIRKIAEEYKE
jgi:hypothetical protein